jgi:hypothetical protein
LWLSVRKGWPNEALIPKPWEIEKGLRSYLSGVVRVSKPDKPIWATTYPDVYAVDVDARHELAEIKAAVVQTVQLLPIAVEAKAHVHVFLSSPKGDIRGVVAPIYQQ